jgi:predicted flap endonuclease-1-like 5' DNA nuclease
MLKYTEYNLDRKRDLAKAHSASAQAKKAAAAKRKAEQAEEGSSNGPPADAKSPKSAKLEVGSVKSKLHDLSLKVGLGKSFCQRKTENGTAHFAWL